MHACIGVATAVASSCLCIDFVVQGLLGREGEGSQPRGSSTEGGEGTA